MNHEHLLLNLLNLKESEVKSVDSVHDSDSISYYVQLLCPEERICPYCGCKRCLSNGYYTKHMIVSSDIFKSSPVYLRTPRLLCRDCGKSFSPAPRSCPGSSSISYDVIIRLMKLLQDPKMTFKSAAKLCGISESSAIRLFDKHCHIEPIRFPEAICIDEVYTKNNDFKSKYSCLIYDFYNGTLIDVLPCRKKDYLSYYLDGFVKGSHLDGVRYVSIDMYPIYRSIARKYFKKAAVCVDPFHVIQLLNRCLCNLRVRLMKAYDTCSQEYYLLKTWKNLLFRKDLDSTHAKKYNRVFGMYMNYYDLLMKMLSISSELEKAYWLKERYMTFNRLETPKQAKEAFSEMYDSFVKANIFEFNDFITALSNWKDEIINSFITYKGRRLNSSVAESVNARVGEVLYNSKGIRNSDRRRKRLMYCINRSGFTIS